MEDKLIKELNEALKVSGSERELEDLYADNMTDEEEYVVNIITEPRNQELDFEYIDFNVFEE